MSEIGQNLRSLQEEIRKTERASNRDQGSVQIVAVSKTFSAEKVREAAAAGQQIFGENRVQEAEEKIQSLVDLDLEWHLIGPLQSNKASRATQLFDVIQTLDRPKLARKLAVYADEMGKILRVLIQVNIGREGQKAGVNPSGTADLIELVDEYPSLDLQGLMAIPPFHSDPEKSRDYFKAMKDLLWEVNEGRSDPLSHLSMGMSADYSVAIEEGATMVRVGTRIFGERRT